MTVTGSFTGAYVSAPREGSSASFLHGVAWGEAGEGAAGAKPPPPSSKPPLSDTGGKPKCLFTPRWQSLRVNFPPHLSCLPSTGVSFDRLKIREGSKLGKEQVSFLLSSPTNG